MLARIRVEGVLRICHVTQDRGADLLKVVRFDNSYSGFAYNSQPLCPYASMRIASNNSSLGTRMVSAPPCTLKGYSRCATRL